MAKRSKKLPLPKLSSSGHLLFGFFSTDPIAYQYGYLPFFRGFFSAARPIHQDWTVAYRDEAEGIKKRTKDSLLQTNHSLMFGLLPYFAYGSNLWLEQMQHRCPNSKVIGIGRIDGWKWIVNSRGFATIVPSEGDSVYGIVYTMTSGDYALLNAFEGPSYTKHELTDSLNNRRVLTYIDRNSAPGFPGIKYIYRLYRGLADGVTQGIPPDYIAKYLHPFLTRPPRIAGSEEHYEEEKNLSGEEWSLS